jgi:hypothetical protein
MSRRYILLYHIVFWIYRIVHILTFNYYVHEVVWYRGAYVVQLVLMPFFYLNYSWLIPALIRKEYKKYAALSIVWILVFFWVYSRWTMYQLHFLYGTDILAPTYNETFDNIIYIWLISTSFCLFEYWVSNLERNKQMAVERKKHLLKSEENKMLNHLLSEYLNTLERKETHDVADKILLVSDFFKYNLYSNDKVVPLKSELGYLRIFEELKNSDGPRIKIVNHLRDEQVLVQATSIISIVNKLIALLNDTREVNMVLETMDLGNALILENSIQYTNEQLTLLKREFNGYPENMRFVIPLRSNRVGV